MLPKTPAQSSLWKGIFYLDRCLAAFQYHKSTNVKPGFRIYKLLVQRWYEEHRLWFILPLLWVTPWVMVNKLGQGPPPLEKNMQTPTPKIFSKARSSPTHKNVTGFNPSQKIKVNLPHSSQNQDLFHKSHPPIRFSSHIKPSFSPCFIRMSFLFPKWSTHPNVIPSILVSSPFLPWSNDLATRGFLYVTMMDVADETTH